MRGWRLGDPRGGGDAARGRERGREAASVDASFFAVPGSAGGRLNGVGGLISRPALFATIVAVSSCAPAPCGGGPPVVLLTRGDLPSVALVDGDRLAIVNGPQGGWHVEVGVHVEDPDPEVQVVLQVDALGALLVDQRYDLLLRDHDGCVGWRGGLLGILDLSAVEGGDGSPADRLAGRPMAVIARVAGSMGEAEARVEVVGGP